MSVSLIALAAAGLASPAAAQDAPAAAKTEAAVAVQDGSAAAVPEAEAPAEGQEVFVTGSRIARPALTSPNPVTSVDQESIQLSGETNLTNYLQSIPALVSSLDSSQTSGSAGFIGSTGLNLLNLRGLGTQRTLILVDGRRHVASLPETAAVDIGTIPQDLIQRIDVATGGVSAVYGADAVSGVVNFVMRKDFEGITGRVQYGAADDGEPVNWTASLTAGTNFADGRGNIAIAYQYTSEGRLRARDRRYLRGANYCTLQENLNDPNDDPNLPDFVPYCGVQFFDTSREGAIDVDFDTLPDFRPNGDVYNIGTFIPPFYSVGGDGTLRGDYIGDLLASNRRHVVNAFLNYEFSPALRLFGELKYAHGRAFSEAQPTFDYTLFISEENPFIPAAVRAQIIPGIGDDLSASFGLPAGTIPDGIAIGRDNFDLGVRAERNTRETWRGVLGFNGDIADGLRYEVSYTYGQSTVRNVSINNRFNDRYFAALDVVTDPVTGQATCRSNLDPTALRDNYTYNYFNGYYFNPANLSFTPGANSGCVPLNLFGEGAANQAAIDWIFTDSLATSKLTQHAANAFVAGNIPGIRLPGGPIAFVVGAEYRRESSRSTPPPEDTAGQTFGNVIFPVSGNFDVKEVFAEVRLPILADLPFAQELEANGAIRFSDYSTVGGTTTWNLGLRWAPIRDLAFRGTWAQTVRAPNIGELFSPQSQTFLFINDPCDVGNLNNGTSTRAANCAAILTALGQDPTTFQDPNSSNIPGFQRGNPDLDEETARSWTLGAVLRPSFIPGLSITVDWYNIKIRDAINTPAAQDIAELCVDQPTTDNVFCDSITRSAVTGGINGFSVQPENVAAFRTSGLDFEVNYRLDPTRLGARGNLGTFNFRLTGNYLHRLNFIPTPGAELDDARTEQYAPKWQATFDLTWVRGPLTVNYGFNYFSATKRYSVAALAGDPDLADPENITFDARHTHDLQMGYQALRNLQIYAGVNNLTNQLPDYSTSYPVNPIGRFFYFGARVNFGN
ncbi:MAG TPA: TonB-dependent receptor [Allosphingosinicella sp.]|nr:TonB-dependent receptor [Allosphingosinicella sp.]